MSNITGSANFVKYSLFLLNFLFVITGIIILSIGVTVQGVYHGFNHFLTDQFFSVPILLIVIGSMIFFIAFFGCCGALRENYCMVIAFSVLLGCIFILELAAGISGYVLRNDTNQILESRLNETLHQYNTTEFNYITVLWDKVQSNFGCCGVHSPKDWTNAFAKIPVSCCPSVSGTMDTFTCNAETKDIFGTGCLDSFGSYIKAHAVSLGAAGLFIALFQLVGVFATCYLAKKIRQGVPPPSDGHNQF